MTAPRVRTPQVMVSYSSQDRERVMQFVGALRAAGVAVWIDQGGIDGAQRWSEEIVNAIEACTTVLLFISRASMASQNIAKEVALAWESGKHFLPVALEEAKIPKSMQYQLAGIQYVKLYEGDPDVKFESVLRALVRLEVRVSPYSMAVVSAGIGDGEQALEWLEKACEERSNGLSRLKSEPRFNPMRSAPRFVELARRAESLSLELEDATAEIVLPAPIPTPFPHPKPPAGPVPTWKRLLWPDIVDGKSAREAAGQGVWAAGALIACFWMLSFFVPTSMITVKSWWNDPIVLTLIWGAIGFGVQKMGRPAAVIGAGLCVLGAFFNLNMLSVFRPLMDQQQIYRSMNPNLPMQPDYSALYYSCLFGVLAGIACVIAFINASRGTLAYGQMVAAGRTEDKQNALSPQDLLASRRKVMSLVQKIWGSGPLVAAKAMTASGAAASAIPPVIEHTNVEEVPVAVHSQIASEFDAVEARPVLAASTAMLAQDRMIVASSSAVAISTSEAAIDAFPKYDDAPEVHTLADLVGSNPMRPLRTLAFLVANIATAMAFILARSVLLPGPMHPVYWQFALLRGIAITLATWLAFRFIRSDWVASIAAAAVTTVLLLAVCQFTLGTFTIADVFYREQFQEFALIPFVDVLVTLLGLAYLIPRVRPLALGIWVGAVCAEVVTSMLITTLRDLGSGAPPDPVLSGTLVFFVGVRSFVFAGVFWGGLRLAKIGKTTAAARSAANSRH
jgi:TIR domain-containing protein